MEEAFHEIEKEAHNRTQQDGEHYFNDRLQYDGENVDATCAQCTSDTEGDGKKDQTNCVVQGNDGEQNGGEGTLCLVLLYDHQGCGRSGCSCNGTQYDGYGQGQNLGHCEMKGNEDAVYQKGGDDCLQNTDDGCLLTDLFQLCETEFVTDFESDKAQCKVTDNGEVFYLMKRGESQTVQSECTQQEGTNEDTCHQISGDGGKIQKLCQTGKEQARKESN